MDEKTSDYAIAAAGLGLWAVGARHLTAHGERARAGAFVSEHEVGLATAASIGGMAITAYGIYRVDETWGTLAAVGLGALALLGLRREQLGEPVLPARLAHALHST